VYSQAPLLQYDLHFDPYTQQPKNTLMSSGIVTFPEFSILCIGIPNYGTSSKPLCMPSKNLEPGKYSWQSRVAFGDCSWDAKDCWSDSEMWSFYIINQEVPIPHKPVVISPEEGVIYNKKETKDCIKIQWMEVEGAIIYTVSLERYKSPDPNPDIIIDYTVYREEETTLDPWSDYSLSQLDPGNYQWVIKAYIGYAWSDKLIVHFTVIQE
jgi:hypothetical protein